MEEVSKLDAGDDGDGLTYTSQRWRLVDAGPVVVFLKYRYRDRCKAGGA